MSATVKAPSRWRRLGERVGDWLKRSSHVFLVGLIVACAVEVLIDWNTTLGEINVLRGSLRQKGLNYAEIVRIAAERAMLSYDWDELGRLSDRLLDDDEVVYVRFVDALGNTLYDRLRPEHGAAFERERRTAFRAHYRRVMERDTRGMITDANRLRQRMEKSRHRDFVQAFNDEEDRLIAWISGLFSSRATPIAVGDIGRSGPRTLYQDRLADASGALERDLTYALGLITIPGGTGEVGMVDEKNEACGVVLIAFNAARTGKAVRGKLIKGLAVTVFFVGLILVQNFSGRRAKLRTMQLEAALGAARAAIRSALPETPAPGWADVGIAFAQAERVGGMIYDLRRGGADADASLELMLAVPAGAGVDAALASVTLSGAYRAMGARPGEPAETARVLLETYGRSPLARDLDLLLVRMGADRRVSGIAAGTVTPHVVDMGTGEVRQVEVGPPPLRPFAVELARGQALAVFSDGMAADEPRLWTPDAALQHLGAMTRGGADAQTLADGLVAEAVRRYRGRQTDDFFALVLRHPT